jgi:glycosyltransferase involved in cell wall biosynthesis
MNPLIVATSSCAQSVAAEIAAGRHHRIEYLELANLLGAPCLDHGVLAPGGLLQKAENRVRLDLRLARRAAELVRRERHNVVISMSERVGLPLARLLPAGVRHVVILHHPLSALKQRAMWLANARASWHRMICISHAEAEALQRLQKLPASRVPVLVTPVDTAFYRPRTTQEPTCHIQSLGSSHRDYETLLRALQRLPHIPCVLRVGSLWVDGAKVRLPLPPNVRIEPFVSPDELRDKYAESRIVVVPLADDTQWSAGCTTVQQAQAMGRAVIASDRPGLRSYLRTGEGGLLVRTADPEALAEAIETLWTNPECTATMGRHGRELVEREQSLDQWLVGMQRILAGL